MRGAKLRYKTIAVDGCCSVKASAFIEEPIDCPDCHDTMLTVYDWDKFSYLCENCSLMLAKTSPKEEEEQ